MENLNLFERAGYTKEESEEFIRISNECGVSYDTVINTLRTLKDPMDIEKAIREFNSKGHNY